jgi:hypothetical protein
MDETLSVGLRAAVDAFVEAPTGENREMLMRAADDYREAWIVARVSAARSSPPAKGKVSSTTYARALEVARIVDGIPVKLALQERTSADVEHPWWTLSWRTKYAADGSNRRFYLTKDGCWTIPASTALEMMDEMEALGGLGEEYFDQRRRPSFESKASTEMTAPERAEAWRGITGPEENWGADPFFVINFDPNDQWKKVLIINTQNRIATFRSITENPAYMPKKILRPDAAWWLDNSMMDANVQQMRIFRSQLKRHESAR